ncbi:MAG TPA: divalent-cation tolerance protein CutA [Haliangiales bacterium]|nr:divalent-cation tolerance protein CutA [Haliangiales bacterium]
MATRFAVALSTAPNADKAAEIARALVRDGLAACVNIVPGVRSIYYWDGELCDSAEVMCVIKTRADRVEALRERLVALHPYEVPELVVMDVTGGHEPYLSWVDASCR